MPIRQFILTMLILMPALVFGQEEDMRRLMDFRGQWKFNIGDNPAWSAPDLDDSGWYDMFVPSRWEDEGFPGYDGFAWYRRTFTVTEAMTKEELFLDVGRIDDVDAVYVNGVLIGMSGNFAPRYKTAYHLFRKYLLPGQLLKPGEENVVAIRVFDERFEGGIIEGRPGLYTSGRPPVNDIELSGVWKFAPDDYPECVDTEYDAGSWADVFVPGFWEPQGFEDFDGIAWYRLEFDVPNTFDASQKWVLQLGKIDDMDETYVNGYLAGSTGNMPGPGETVEVNLDDYQVVRMYEIPAGIIEPGKTNVVSVKVYDGLLDGGIYTGPIGLITWERFGEVAAQQKEDGKKKSLFDSWLEFLRDLDE